MKRYGTIWGLVCLLAICVGGCNEAQRQEVDRWAPVAEDVGQAAGEFTTGPGGEVLPPDVRFWGSIGGLSLAAIAAIWQAIRKGQATAEATAALESVVKAVDKAGPGHKDAVKDLVTTNATGAALIERAKRA